MSARSPFSQEEQIAFEAIMLGRLSQIDSDAAARVTEMKAHLPTGYSHFLQATMLASSLSLVAKDGDDLSVVGSGCITPSRDLLKLSIVAMLTDEDFTSLVPGCDIQQAADHVDVFVTSTAELVLQ